jgi:uncharacterized SAM-binding protein YcdF (DUF218 family)
VIRWPLRIAGAFVAVAVLYVSVTFGQVWWASRQDEAAPASAIVVLGAAQWDGKPSPVLQARLDHAAELRAAGMSDVIVVTGGKQVGDRVTQGFAGYDYLTGLGVPDESLLVEVEGTDTYTELAATATILAGQGLGNDVVLVSDPYHSLRSASVAREVGLDPMVSPTGGDAGAAELVRETAAVALGRLVGFRRLSNWT